MYKRDVVDGPATHSPNAIRNINLEKPRRAWCPGARSHETIGRMKLEEAKEVWCPGEGEAKR